MLTLPLPLSHPPGLPQFVPVCWLDTTLSITTDHTREVATVARASLVYIEIVRWFLLPDAELSRFVCIMPLTTFACAPI